MKFKDRNFPYPVLAPQGDDVADSAFQATYDIRTDHTALYATIRFALSNETLDNLIKAGRAAFVVQADCNVTFFRKVITSHEDEATFTIPFTDIKRQLSLAFFICATEKLTDYTIKGMNSLYGDTTFQLRGGDILAYAEGAVVDILDKDSLNKLASIMLVREGNADLIVPHIDYDGDKISVSLPPAQYAIYGQYKGHQQVKALVLTTVVLPVLVDAVQRVLDTNEDQESEFSSFLWFKVLRHRVTELTKLPGMPNDSAYSLAQAVLSGVSEKALNEIQESLGTD